MHARIVTTGSPRLAEGVARGPRLTRLRRTALALATAALATLGLAAPALADETIGQTGADPSTCFGPSVRADTNYVVPGGGGTITSFSFESVAANAGQQLDFLVLRPAGGSNYTVVGKSGLVTLAGTGAVETFAADIDVQSGDILGVWSGGMLDNCLRNVATGGGAIQAAATTDPSVGDTVSLTGAGQFDWNESANLVTTPTPTIADLIDSVEALDLPRGTKNSLLKKLTGAQRNLDSGDSAGACDKLASFTSQVKAQKGKKINPGSAADDLVAEAEAIQGSVGCG